MRRSRSKLLALTAAGLLTAPALQGCQALARAATKIVTGYTIEPGADMSGIEATKELFDVIDTDDDKYISRKEMGSFRRKVAIAEGISKIYEGIKDAYKALTDKPEK